ncbi:hypothetical protein AOQ84DRAFT_303670 [Glonium stellatum]|uniref:Uncharacterized protein n=1 Tax=Glonium stellatum TaxID=574774 RepID=A0A8E2EQE0_9PEZI|nr:hypothetical protein AOQ84DRAFT_303670 [Glonium stellatum]
MTFSYFSIGGTSSLHAESLVNGVTSTTNFTLNAANPTPGQSPGSDSTIATTPGQSPGLDSTIATIPTTALPSSFTPPTASIGQSSGLSSTLPTASSNITTGAGPKPTSTSTPIYSGVSKGGAAGIGIGCTVAGAAIAFLLFWFLKRGSKNEHHAQGPEAGAFASHRDKHPIINVKPVDNASSITKTVENNLPQPLEDNAIAGEISKIGNLIKNHVQSYYHSSRIIAGTVNFDALQALGDGFPISVETLNTMLTNTTTRETALRLCIAWVVISRVQPDDDPRITFLPPDIASCISSMNGLEDKPQVRTAFLSKWRTLTAELMQTTYGRNAFSGNDARNHSILKAVEILDAVLQPYADTRIDNNQRRRNLEEMLKRAASFAFMLFSQPSSWKLDWHNTHGSEPGSLVIFPALVQVIDDTGRLLNPPRRFSEVVVRQIDG